MEPETAIYEKAIVEVRDILVRPHVMSKDAIDADKILQQAQKDIDNIRVMRQVAREEIKKQFDEM